ncbi:MAG: hypothetical protein ACREHD_16120, partial [Pirellulales bacterium]
MSVHLPRRERRERRHHDAGSGADHRWQRIRNCPWSYAFLHEVYQQEHFIDHPWWENAAIMQLVQREDVQPHVQVYPEREPHGGFHGYRIYPDYDKIFIHHAGLRGIGRMLLIENLVRLAELPSPLRMLTRTELGQLLNRMGCSAKGSSSASRRATSPRRFSTLGKGGGCTSSMPGGSCPIMWTLPMSATLSRRSGCE